MSKNYYQILEIPTNSTKDEIKKAYKKLALKFHPDKNKATNAVEQFRLISEAYQVLTEQREQYDRTLEIDKTKLKDPFKLFSSFFSNLNPEFGSFVETTLNEIKDVIDNNETKNIKDIVKKIDTIKILENGTDLLWNYLGNNFKSKKPLDKEIYNPEIETKYLEKELILLPENFNGNIFNYSFSLVEIYNYNCLRLRIIHPNTNEKIVDLEIMDSEVNISFEEYSIKVNIEILSNIDLKNIDEINEIDLIEKDIIIEVPINIININELRKLEMDFQVFRIECLLDFSNRSMVFKIDGMGLMGYKSKYRGDIWIQCYPSMEENRNIISFQLKDNWEGKRLIGKSIYDLVSKENK